MAKKSSKSVLVVDDEIDVVQFISETVSEYNPEATVFKAESAADANKIIESNKIDLLITDIKLERDNAVDILRKVSSMPEKERPEYILVVSGFIGEDHQKLLSKLNIATLPKPFKKEELEDYLFQSLKKSVENFHLADGLKEEMVGEITTAENAVTLLTKELEKNPETPETYFKLSKAMYALYIVAKTLEATILSQYCHDLYELYDLTKDKTGLKSSRKVLHIVNESLIFFKDFKEGINDSETIDRIRRRINLELVKIKRVSEELKRRT